jgi:N-acetylglucosaminyl-diphospho-decaprenol L-rhamnosyltransferase
MNIVDVAVVIVTYRSAELTVDCLRSIVSEQSASGLRIRAIVVDNASGDAPSVTRAIEENGWSSWVTLIEAPRNGGFAYGNNLGFQRALAEGSPTYLHMLNPDTRVLPGGISELVRFLETHPDVGIAGSQQEDDHGDVWRSAFGFPSMLGEFATRSQLGTVQRLLRPMLPVQRLQHTAGPVDWIGGASLMIRREVLEAIGGMDEGYFLYFEEVDFCYRAGQAGFSTWHVPESRVTHIAGQSTQITGHDAAPKRMPAYWYESRRRCFNSLHGAGYAIFTDIVALLGYGLGALKRGLTRRGENAFPYFATDLIKYSLLWPENRRQSAVKHVPRFALANEGVTTGFRS